MTVLLDSWLSIQYALPVHMSMLFEFLHGARSPPWSPPISPGGPHALRRSCGVAVLAFEELQAIALLRHVDPHHRTRQEATTEQLLSQWVLHHALNRTL